MANSVSFRRFEMRDVDFIYQCKNDKVLNKFTVGTISEFSHKDAEDWVNHCMIGDREDMKFWAICTNDSDQRCVGWASLVNINQINQSAETGAIFIGDNDYNDGFAWIESVIHLFNYGFEVLKLNRIYGVSLVGHPTSNKVGALMFMQKEGILRQAIFKKNKFYDIQYDAILKEEYFAHKNDGDYEIKSILRRLRKLRHG